MSPSRKKHEYQKPMTKMTHAEDTTSTGQEVEDEERKMLGDSVIIMKKPRYCKKNDFLPNTR